MYPLIDGWLELKYKNNPLSPAQKDFIEEAKPTIKHWTFYWLEDKIKIVYNDELQHYMDLVGVSHGKYPKDMFFNQIIDILVKMKVVYAKKYR